MGRGVMKNIKFIIILVKVVSISGLIVVLTTCSVDMLDYIENKIVLDEISYRDMVSITGGTFTQESIDDPVQLVVKERFVHSISSFKLAKYEVSYELWYTVHDWALSNGYVFANPGREGNDGTLINPAGSAPTGARYEPVTFINWRDAIVWCNAYSEMSWYSPVYENGTGQVIRDSRDTNAAECDAAVPVWTNSGYRLPTEGEWQFASSSKGATLWNCGSGGTGAFTGNNLTDYPLFDPIAWYGNSVTYPDGNTIKTQNVGSKTANQLGIHDMSGNVSEWCWDWYDIYPGDSSGYTGPSSSPESKRVFRGGSSAFSASFLRIGFRLISFPSTSSTDLGFRLARRK